MTARQIMQLPDGRLIGFHRNRPPFQAESMQWWRYPELVARQKIPPPSIPTLPALPEEAAGDQAPNEPALEPDGHPETWQALFPRSARGHTGQSLRGQVLPPLSHRT